MRKAEPVYTPVYAADGTLADIRASLGGRELAMLGGAGPARELAILPDFASFDPAGRLPVLLGSGLGHALKKLAAWLERAQGPDFHLAVVDKESAVAELPELADLRASLAKHKNLIWLDEAEADAALKQLSQWQIEQAGKAFFPIVNPFYLRLDRPYYGALRDALASSASYDFWSRADYAKFQGGEPRILLITSKYFLIGEMEAACKRLGLSYSLLTVPDQEIGLTEFLEQLLTALVTFKPDFALTINHLGVDREGVLQNFLAKVKLPLASWFVDNPHLILYHYHNLVSPWTAVFTWDADNLASLRKMGFEHVFYLPLGTDHTRFVPQDARELARHYPQWVSDVSFVGNSMLLKVQKRLEQIRPPAFMLENFQKTAAGFAESNERSVRDYLRKEAPDQYKAFLELGEMERQLGYEAGLTWEATLQYRLSCVRQTLPFAPLIVGDQGWFDLLPVKNGAPEGWRYFHELTYYTDLPLFYPLSKINFNCTSKQMKGAVNQRIFDVPAAGAFVITDWREQIENLFEPGKEVVCFHSPEEVPELIRHYLKHPAEREKIIRAARRRVMAQHRYENRLTEIIDVMRKTFS